MQTCEEVTEAANRDLNLCALDAYILNKIQDFVGPIEENPALRMVCRDIARKIKPAKQRTVCNYISEHFLDTAFVTNDAFITHLLSIQPQLRWYEVEMCMFYVAIKKDEPVQVLQMLQDFLQRPFTDGKKIYKSLVANLETEDGGFASGVVTAYIMEYGLQDYLIVPQDMYLECAIILNSPDLLRKSLGLDPTPFIFGKLCKRYSRVNLLGYGSQIGFISEARALLTCMELGSYKLILDDVMAGSRKTDQQLRDIMTECWNLSDMSTTKSANFHELLYDISLYYPTEGHASGIFCNARTKRGLRCKRMCAVGWSNMTARDIRDTHPPQTCNIH